VAAFGSRYHHPIQRLPRLIFLMLLLLLTTV
jgi:hypothetical protein